MVYVVSVSLGSSARDHTFRFKVGAETVQVSRRGTDGDLARAALLVRELDGSADAIGLGGVNRWLRAGRRRYPLRDGAFLARQAARTPVCDGSLMKAAVEPGVVEFMEHHTGEAVHGRTALVSSVLDRWELAEALAGRGARLIVGDPAFALGLPWTPGSLGLFSAVAPVTLPFLSRLPISCIYPVGRRQEEQTPRFPSLFRKADILAGDFHFLRRYMPPRLEGKLIIASSLTPGDLQLLKARGAKACVTASPDLGGRSFGANVMEAVVVAIARRSPLDMGPAEFKKAWDSLGLKHRFELLDDR